MDEAKSGAKAPEGGKEKPRATATLLLVVNCPEAEKAGVRLKARRIEYSGSTFHHCDCDLSREELEVAIPLTEYAVAVMMSYLGKHLAREAGADDPGAEATDE